MAFVESTLATVYEDDVAALRDYCATITLQPHFQQANQSIVVKGEGNGKVTVYLQGQIVV